MSYQRLFDPPSQDDLEYLPDPMGRLDMGSYVEKAEEFPDPGWEAARGDWMNGAPLGEIFGDGLFDLQAGVGADQANRRGDVFKLQALLHREGYLDSAATDGPTGYWGGRDDYALRNFQKENGLSIDGFAEPGGETMSTIKGFYKPQPGFRTMEKRDGDPEPVLRPIGLGGDGPLKPTLLSSDTGRGNGAGASDMAQLETQQTSALVDTSAQVPAKPPVERAPPKPAARPAAPGQDWKLNDTGMEELKAVAEQNAALKKIGREKDGEYLSPDGVKPGTDREQCVVLVQKVLPGIGYSKSWQEGEKLKADGSLALQPGTAIATFRDGQYPGESTGNHAAIFLKYDEEKGRKGIWVLDQSVGRPAMERFIPFDDKANSMSRNAGAFSVIQRRSAQPK